MNQTYIWALVGGVLIGLASALPLWWQGRVAGASGLLSDLISKNNLEKKSASYYILGLISGAFLIWVVNKEVVASATPAIDMRLIVGALLVGYGARLGGGCTSGHGVCGMARFSKRSIVATLVFLSVSIVVATLMRTF